MIIHVPFFSKQTTSIDAITLGCVIIIWVKDPSNQLVLHEKEHVKQWLRQPFTFHARYFYEMFRNKLKGMTWRDSYLNISYEIEARAASKSTEEIKQ
jgi:hypothetical protein